MSITVKPKLKTQELHFTHIHDFTQANKYNYAIRLYYSLMADNSFITYYFSSQTLLLYHRKTSIRPSTSSHIAQQLYPVFRILYSILPVTNG